MNYIKYVVLAVSVCVVIALSWLLFKQQQEQSVVLESVKEESSEMVEGELSSYTEPTTELVDYVPDGVAQPELDPEVKLEDLEGLENISEERKSAGVLKMGIITDTQLHASRIDKSQDSETAKRYIKPRYGDAIDAFVARMKDFEPDIIAVPGDVIEGTGDTDIVGIAGLELIREKIEKVGAENFWVIGNHDLRSVTRMQFKQALGMKELNSWKDIGDYRVITLDSNYDSHGNPVTPQSDRYIRGYIPRHVLDFLEGALDTDKKTIVIVHHPPVGEDEGMPNKVSSQLMLNVKEVQDVLSSGGADIVVSGHVEEKHRYEYSGVKYYVLPGAIKNEEYKGAYYEMEIVEGEVKLVMWYQDSQTGKYVAIDFVSEKPL